MVELFKVGSFQVYLFGIAIALGILGAMFIILKETNRKHMETEEMMDVMFYTLIASFIGARVYYIIAFDLKFYISNPMQIFAIRNGGLSIQGGILFGIVFAIIYTKIRKINFWKVADTFAPGIIMGQAIGRFGCDVFGIPMEESYFWGVNYNSVVRHPVQLYEAFLNLALFIILWKYRDRQKYHGQTFVRYIIGFSIIRGSVEFFRINPIIWGPITIVHLTSVLIIVAALFMRARIKKKYAIMKHPLPDSSRVNNQWIYFITVLIASIGTWFFYNIH